MADCDEIDEAEEEALLKSDDEYDLVRVKKTLLGKLLPPTDEEDSLINEAVQLESKCEQRIPDSMESDDSDVSDNENDSSNQALTEYQKILKELEDNKYAYDKYLRLCDLSHTTEDLDNIRNSYNIFANVYPLAPEIWLKYLRIEKNLAVSAEEINHVENYFRKAIADYYSVDVALEFASFAEHCSDSEDIWRELLGTYGFHCMRGQEFFKLYRQCLLSQDKLRNEEQQTNLVESYLRELKIPLNNMEETYIEFKVFCEKNKGNISIELDWEDIDSKYFKAKSSLEKILVFEKELEKLDLKCFRERTEVYERYIKKSEDFLDENILQTIFERMVADACLNPECWLKYIDFIDDRNEVYGRLEQLLDLPLFRQSSLDISSRSLRNCSWSEKLYIKRMQLLEKLERPREEIQEVLESSMSVGFQTAEPAVAVWVEYLTFLRRHTKWESEEDRDILRKNFNLAWTILGKQWGVLADCNCEILQFWGRLEYGPLQDPKRGKELWTTVMESADNGSKSGLWIEFAHLEMRRDLDATRKLFRKSLHTNNLDNPYVIAAAWERLERCNGTLSTLKACLKECSKFLFQYKTHYSYISNMSSKQPTTLRGSKRKSNSVSDEPKEVKKTKNQPNTTTEKIVLGTSREKAKITYKEHENAEIDLTHDHLRIFVSNLDYDLNENDLRTGLPELRIINVDLIRSANGKSRGFGYLELSSEAEVKKALTLDRRTLNGRPLFISSVLRDKEKRQKFKYSDGLEPRKLFVKGLPPDASKEEVERLFSSYGRLQDVRLVFHKSGKFKNIAYVEYVEETAASKAVLGADQSELRGHTISVAISAPPSKPEKSSISMPQLLGVNIKRSKTGTEQKPRMSLIPSVIRRQLNSASNSILAAKNGSINVSKTNADFQKLLEK